MTVLIDRTTALETIASASWPESTADATAPSLAGFIVSSFSPIAAALADRCLGRREAGEPRITAVIIASALGDVAGAIHVARAIDAEGRIGPLLFFQSVPNAVAGYIAARHDLTGPVVCVGDVDAAHAIAALLIEDGDTDEALLLHIESGQASAVLVRAAGAGAADAAADVAAHVPASEGGQP